MKSLILLLFFSINSFAIKPTLVSKFDDIVWGFTFINKDEVLLNLKEGKSFHLNLKTGKKTQIITPKSTENGQGGLLDIYFYEGSIFYTFAEKRGSEIITSLAKARWDGKKALDLKVVFRSNAGGDSGRHFGSRILIKNNELYMTIGDRVQRKLAQNLDKHNGSILRMDLNGKPIKSNPFYQDEKSTRSYIFSYGHRNPQGIDLNPVDGEIYALEFGPRGGDELNLVKKGLNYGWPVITYGKEYWGPSIGPTHKEGMEQPVKYWTPSISPSGMTIIKGSNPKESIFFLGCLGNEEIRKVTMSNGKVIKEESLFKSLEKRIRQVRKSPSGDIYFSTDDGDIYKFKN